MPEAVTSAVTSLAMRCSQLLCFTFLVIIITSPAGRARCRCCSETVKSHRVLEGYRIDDEPSNLWMMPFVLFVVPRRRCYS